MLSLGAAPVAVGHPFSKPRRSSIPSSLSTLAVDAPVGLQAARGRHGRRLLVSASRRGRGGGSDAEEDGGEWEEEEEEVDEEEGIGMSLQDMRVWYSNKPAGFGEGKTYDTSVEESILEEMETITRAQLANINKLKNGASGNERSKKEALQKKAIDVVPIGTRVRIWNLPRKKNIHRDLNLAFKSFQGVVKISPAVNGNKKTKDPICKGFAFIDFVSEEVASRFVQRYSKQNVLFGKVEKQISCDVMNSRLPSMSPDQSEDETSISTQANLSYMEEEVSKCSTINKFSQASELAIDASTRGEVNTKTEDESTDFINGPDELSLHSDVTDMGAGQSLSDNSDNEIMITGDAFDPDGSLSSVQKQSIQIASRRKTLKTKSDNVAKLNVPASMARLKIRERAVMNGVFSKYGGKVASTSSKEN